MNPLTKFGAALFSGGIGSAVCNPCDLIKTRQQKALAPSHPQYNISSNLQRHLMELRECLQTEGLSGMYRGWQATSAR